jgi:O-acetyl-ADP-ribose deacetylase (regulator of RNase III)
MIRVLLSHPSAVECEAILRSISSSLEADTPFSREVELLAGADVSERLQSMGELPIGAAVITPGGGLSAMFLIHVVLQSPEEPVTPGGVRAALRNGLRRGEEWGVGSMAIPPLGTGAGNMDAEESADLMVPLIQDHLGTLPNPPKILIVVGNEYEKEVFVRAVESDLGHAAARDV